MRAILAPLLLLSALSVAAQADRLSPKDFQAALAKPGVQLVDVRTSEEFATGHLANARNIDYVNGDFLAGAAKLDKTKPVLLYCAAGGRSESALHDLKAAGFTNVHDMLGGIKAWRKDGLPEENK